MKIKHILEEEIPVTLQVGQYHNNGNLYIGLITEDENGDSETYGDLTVNFMEALEDYYAYVDINNNPHAEQFILDNELGISKGNSIQSGFCSYPLYFFHAEKLRELCPDEIAKYEGGK